MKIQIYKVKHYWQNKENATWIKSKDFDKDIFNELKNQYETIKYTKPKYIELQGRNIILFYKDSKDIFGRDITELSAFLFKEKIIDTIKLYDDIKKQITNPFDDNMEINLDINADLINTQVKKSKKLLFYVFIILFFVGVILYFQVSGDKESIIQEIESNKNKWKWGEFCIKNQNEYKDSILKKFIEDKCATKDNFKGSITEYFEGYSYNKDILKSLSPEEKVFFGVENEFK